MTLGEFLAARLGRILLFFAGGAAGALFLAATGTQTGVLLLLALVILPAFLGVQASDFLRQRNRLRELEEILDRFLHTLPERDCNVFLRRYWYGETLEEAARRYGMKLNTVKTSLYRSREKLRKYLEKEGVAL